jgi:hypothetical protein
MSEHSLKSPDSLTDEDLALLGSFMHYVAEELTAMLEISADAEETETVTYKNLESFITHLTDNLYETTEITH